MEGQSQIEGESRTSELDNRKQAYKQTEASPAMTAKNMTGNPTWWLTKLKMWPWCEESCIVTLRIRAYRVSFIRLPTACLILGRKTDFITQCPCYQRWHMFNLKLVLLNTSGCRSFGRISKRWKKKTNIKINNRRDQTTFLVTSRRRRWPLQFHSAYVNLFPFI